MVLWLMSPIRKIHLLTSLVQCRTCCANLDGSECLNFIFMLCLVVSWLVFVLSIITLICCRLRNGFHVVEPRKKYLELLLKLKYVGRFLVGIVILCKNVILKLIVEMAMMLGFLLGSFLMEPLNQVVQ